MGRVLFASHAFRQTLGGEHLLDRGVLVRDLTHVVPRALRVSAGTEEETTAFLDALEEVAQP